MKTPPFPENERARLKALRDLAILDTAPEARFDRLTRLAQQLFNVPIALISLVDDERQWFKSRQGLDACETSRDISFCGHAILGEDVFYIPNALDDKRFADNPLVTGPPHIRFYAGMPLTTHEGYRVGTLCIISDKPRELSEAEFQSLRDLGKCVEDEISQARLQQIARTFYDQEAYLRAVLETVNDGVITIDSEGIIQTVNPATSQLFGYSPDELIGRNVKTLMPEAYAQHHDDYIRNYLKSGEGKVIAIGREVSGQRKDGSVFPLELQVSRMLRPGGEHHFVGVVRDIEQRKNAELVQQLLQQDSQRSHHLLDTISRAQSQFISDADIRAVFDQLLQDLLQLSESEYGFIGEVLYTTEGQPYLKSQAITNISWNHATRTFYEENIESGMEFYNLNTLFGEVMKTGKSVIANDPLHDSRSGGLPTGHPPLKSFLGQPFYLGKKLVGMVGIANRKAGYDQTLIDFLQPLLKTCAQLIEALRNDDERQRTTQELNRFKHTLDQTLDMIFIFDAETLRFEYLNDGAIKSMGYSRDELLQLTPYDIKPRITEAEFHALIQPLRDGQESSLHFETLHRRKDGTDFPVEIFLQLVREKAGKARFVAIVRDISERRLAENEANLYTNALEQLHNITSDVRLDLAGRIHAILNLGCEVFGLSMGIVSHIQDNTYRVDHVVAAGEAPPAGTIFQLGDTYCAEMLRANRPMGFNHVANSTLANHPCYKNFALEAYLGTPLHIGDKVYGTLNFSSASPREQLFTTRHYSLIKLFAQWIGNMIEQERISSELYNVTSLRQAILDSANFTIISTDTDGIIKTFNKGAQRLLGYSEQEVVNKLTPAVIHDGDEVVARAKVLSEELGYAIEPGFEVFVAKARQGRADENEWTYIHKDGSRFPVLLSVTALRNKQNEITGFLGIGSDIAERKMAQASLAHERQRLAGIIEGTHIGTWEWNIQTGKTVFNERWAEIVGYTLDELSPVSIQTWLDLAHPDDLEESGHLIQQHFSGELPYYDIECRMRHKDGHWVWVHDRGRIVSWTEDGKPLLMSGTHADITARKLADEALRASEQKLSSLYRMAPVAIALNRFADGKFIEGNPELYRMVGYSEAEFRQLSYWDITPEEYAKQEVLQIESLRNRGTYGPYEKEFLHKDGHRFPVLLNGTLITGQDGETYIWSIVQDISERVRSERALKERERYTRTIIDNVVDGIITLNQHGSIESFNAAAERMFGRSAKQVVSNNITMLVPVPVSDVNRMSVPEFLHSCLVKSEHPQREHEGLRNNGDRFPIEFLVSEISYGGEKKFVAVVRDITERKRVDRMKNEFISTVSHELRTPLTSIKGALSLILSKNARELSPKALNMLQTASRNSERLTLLINDILDLEKIETGRLQFEFKPCDLVAIAHIALLANETYAQQHTVHLELASDVDTAVVFADEHRLQQVFANLLSNAIKFSPANSMVEIIISRQATAYRVSVKDHGRGIPQEFRSRIFQRFAQADSSDTREKGGTGLGLSISKAIVERLGGSIDYQSAEGSGTEFYFELPEYNDTPVTAGHDSHRLRVLLCQDNLEVSSLIADLFEQAGIVVDIATTAQTARVLLNEHDYRILLIDNELPDADGLQLLQEIREQQQHPALPVIILSSSEIDDTTRQNDQVMGISSWLQQPVERQQIRQALRKALAQARATRILHVEDDPDMIQIMQSLVEEVGDYSFTPTLREARRKLSKEHFELIILDVTLPDGSGLDLLNDIPANIPVILFSGSEPETAFYPQLVAALVKSKVSHARLLATIKKAINQ